jgi:inner membrane protein
MDTQNDVSQTNEYTKLNSKSFFEKAALGFKMFLIGFIVLLLLIPMLFIGNLITERQSRKDEVVADITEKWGSNQKIVGPYISVPYKDTEINPNNNVSQTVIKYAHFMPENLSYEAKPITEIRKRGIFEVILYRSEINIKGNFPVLDLNKLDIDPSRLDFENAFLNVGISDIKGLSDFIKIDLGTQQITLEPNTKNTGIFENGVTKKINYSLLKTQTISFKTVFTIKGAGELQFIPIAKQTKANIKSDWSSPSFNGEFLPDSKEKVKKGFNASWSIPLTQRMIPMSWLSNQIDIKDFGFGVDLLLPVNNYSTADRTVKYAILIIGLTFLVFFFIENIKGRSIHPLQYILVGFSLVLFYALLVSFSEHIDFNLAYLISSLMTATLISLYLLGVLKENKLASIIFGTLGLLYGFIFVLVQLEDFALLMGSLGLFFILAVVMYFSRKIDWYQKK